MKIALPTRLSYHLLEFPVAIVVPYILIYFLNAHVTSIMYTSEILRRTLLCKRLLLLGVDDAGRGGAQDALAEQGNGAAASALANLGADGAEVVGAGRHGVGDAAVEVREAEDVGRAALGVGVEAAARRVRDLALNHGGGGEGDAGEEGNGGELHFDGWW